MVSYKNRANCHFSALKVAVEVIRLVILAIHLSHENAESMKFRWRDVAGDMLHPGVAFEAIRTTSRQCLRAVRRNDL
jgi:hypothetical protein